MKKPFVVDYNKENACKLVFPSDPLLKSKKAQFFVNHYELSPHAAPLHAPAQHVIVTYADSTPLALKRELGGVTKDEFVQNGDIMISPAQVPHAAHWDRKVELTLLLFDPKQIAEAAYEYIDPDRVELLPHFARPDPVVDQISRALVMQLENHAYIDSAGIFLSMHLLQNYCSRDHKLDKDSHYALTKAELRQIVDYIESNIDRKGIVLELSNLIGMSQFHFGRLFKKSFGATPLQYLIERRIQKASDLLVKTDFDLKTISEKVGFPSQSNFSSTFQQRLGVLPSQYRKKS